MNVFPVKHCKDEGADAEHHSRESEGKPETNVAFGVDHGDLANDRADVNAEIEIHKNTLRSESGIQNNLHAFPFNDAHLGVLQLLDHKRGDIRSGKCQFHISKSPNIEHIFLT